VRGNASTCLEKNCDIERINYGDPLPQALPHRYIRVAGLLSDFKEIKVPPYFEQPQVIVLLEHSTFLPIIIKLAFFFLVSKSCRINEATYVYLSTKN
jgi:hypothetical protein